MTSIARNGITWVPYSLIGAGVSLKRAIFAVAWALLGVANFREYLFHALR